MTGRGVSRGHGRPPVHYGRRSYGRGRARQGLTQEQQPQQAPPQEQQPHSTPPQEQLSQSTLPLSQPQSQQQPHPQHSYPQQQQPHPLPSPQQQVEQAPLEQPQRHHQHRHRLPLASFPPPNVSFGLDPSDGKTWIIPEGKDSFYPNPNKVVRELVQAIKEKFDKPINSWREADKDTQDRWIQTFQKKYKWLPKYDIEIRKHIAKKGAKCLRDHLCDARRKREIDGCPGWIPPDIWEQLCQHWNDEAYKEKCQKAKQNRAPPFGGSLHIGGSISAYEHKRKLTKQNNSWVPNFEELYIARHTKKGTKGLVFDDQHFEEEYMKWKALQEEKTKQWAEGEGTSGALNDALDADDLDAHNDEGEEDANDPNAHLGSQASRYSAHRASTSNSIPSMSSTAPPIQFSQELMQKIMSQMVPIMSQLIDQAMMRHMSSQSSTLQPPSQEQPLQIPSQQPSQAPPQPPPQGPSQ